MRTKAREAAAKIVFASFFQENGGEYVQKSVYQADALNEEERQFADRLVGLVSQHKEELLSALTERIERFPEYRIYRVDKAVMLVALAEMRYCDDVPALVSVSEAAGIARKYSTVNSADFVNGVLGSFLNHDAD